MNRGEGQSTNNGLLKNVTATPAALLTSASNPKKIEFIDKLCSMVLAVKDQG